MILLIEILLDEYSDESCIYLSWDAASWHASKRLFARVDEINDPNYRKQHRVPLVKLAPLPARAQFLNVIESVFSGMARAVIHNSDYASVDECKRAIEIDPNFAAAYTVLGVEYASLGETRLGREYTTKAYQLREHTSEREKFAITSFYHSFVTGDLQALSLQPVFPKDPNKKLSRCERESALAGSLRSLLLPQAMTRFHTKLPANGSIGGSSSASALCRSSHAF